ncbi:MAG: hypothetical protein ABI353_11450 [Isosphaeraceae bacterium]
MPITRARAEAVLVDRCGPWMVKATMDVTFDGANPSLNESLRQGLTQSGYTVADPFLVTDADLAALDVANDLDEFLDRAELRVLRTVQTRLVKVTTMVEAVQVLNSDLIRGIDAVVKEKTAQVKASWGLPGGKLSSGVLSLDFAQAAPGCEGE